MTARRATVIALCALCSMSLFASGGADQAAKGPRTFTLLTVETTKPDWAAYLANIEKVTGVKINAIPTPTDTDARQQKITTLLSSGDTSVDVILINDEMISAFKNTGWLQPLQNDVMTPEVVKNFVAQQYIKDMIMSKSGDILTVPFYRGMLAFWVDQKALDSVGMKAPTNLDEFIKVVKATTNANRFGYGGAWEKTYVFNEIGTFVNLFGGDYYDWKNPANKKAIEFMYDMVNTWKVTPMAQMSEKYAQMDQKAIDGKIAMWFRWGAGDPYRPANRYGKDQIHIAEMPMFATRSAYADSWGHTLSKASKNKPAAYEFLKYTASKQGNLDAWKSLLRYPARGDAEADTSVAIDIKEIYGVYGKTTTLRGRPMLPQTMEFITDMGTIFQQYIQNKMSADEFCVQAQKFVEKYR
jgi:multiple sugar transport system substrate-binding protein